MFKKLSLICAAVLAGGLMFAEPLAADGGASPASAGSVNAEWKWDKIPKSKIGTDWMSFRKPVVLEAVAGLKGAYFQLDNGEAKFKQEDYVAIYHNNADSCRLENLKKKRKCEYLLKIDDAATITLSIAGNGGKSPSRLICLVKDDETIADAAAPLTPILFADNLSGDEAPFEITYSNAPAGTYRIYANGSRIVKVSAKN